MKRRQFLKTTSLAAGSTLLAPRLFPDEAQPGSSRPNLLFLMTDQQQSLALSLAGNRILPTPNLDALAKSGVLFSNAYSACPLCVPARTSILTGRSIRTTGVINNLAFEKPHVPSNLTGKEGIFKCQTFDEILVDNGYVAEYYGKWHSRFERAQKYANVQTVGLVAERYRAYIADNKLSVKNPPGGLIDRTWRNPYIPDPMDPKYGPNGGLAARITGNNRKEREASARALGIPEGEGAEVGRTLIPASHSITAFIANETIAALERLAKQPKPFSVTCSIPPPHPPYIAPSPYYEMFPAKEMPIPTTLRDPMSNNPYEHSGNRLAWCQNPATIGYLIGNYYALIKEADDWVGKILATLDRLNLRDNTLVVFLSDHGEMLGAHGMFSKMVFLDESSHIPMIFSHPGQIPSGKAVTDIVGHIDVYATILDCLGVRAPASEGASLTPLIKGESAKRNPFTVSEWPEGSVPNYMVRDSQWKFMFGNSPHARGLDGLFDLRNDPYETRNLIGSNPDRNQYKAQAETMKDMLLAWLTQVNSPELQGVRERSVLM